MKNLNVYYFPWFFIIIFLFQGCHSRDQKQSSDQAVTKRRHANFTISGAYALYPLAQIWADEYRQFHPEVRITVFPASSSKGKTDALLGIAEIGLYSGLQAGDLSEDLITFKVAKDAVVPTINRHNPFLDEISEKGFTIENLRDIYITGKIDNWKELTGVVEEKMIIAFTRSDVSGAAAVWAEFLNTTQDYLSGIGVYGDAGMTQAVRSNIYSLGYDNLRFVYDNNNGKLYPGLFVPPIDFNMNDRIDPEERLYTDIESLKEGIRSGDYPYPLARNLYVIVNRDQINPFVRDFLSWILTRGAELTEGAGYVGLSDEEINHEISKLTLWRDASRSPEE